ncbi:hypothetical protein QEN19_003786 [Hanseniaspora menglaensis]
MILTATAILLGLLPLFFYVFIPVLHDLPHRHYKQKKIMIIVIGPLIRSPRMLNHIKSFLVNGFEVEVVGQADSDELKDLELKFSNFLKNEEENLHFNIINNKKVAGSKLGLITKVLNQFSELLLIFWKLRSCDYVLMQNPPSIPLLPLLILSKIFFSWKIIIDWHNFGYSILALKFKNDKALFVRVYYFIEIFFGKFADYHLTVTHKMKTLLIETWKIKNNEFKKGRISVLHDKPDSQFYPVDKSDRAAIIKAIPELAADTDLLQNINKYTIAITSTSFTPDEDLDMLLNAMDALNKQLLIAKKHLLLIITGKGPLKQEFMKKFKDKTCDLNYITVNFFYLKIQDYPKILQVSDFGLSLHYSSSGVDLPMKVLDMFGCGLPCLSYYYPTVEEELIQIGVTGDVFKNETELSSKIFNLIVEETKREEMKANVIADLKNGDRWIDSWLKSFKGDLNIVR